jgi:hypothetical protein
LIHGIYPEKPEDTEEFSGSREVFTVSAGTNWYETEASAHTYYEERHREIFGEAYEGDEDVKHAIEHGYAEYGAWR